MKTLQILSLVFDAVLVIVGIGAVLVYRGQLNVMRGTLDEMKRSGGESTQQVWRAIDNINWLARTMDASLKQAQRAADASEKQSNKALNASIEASRLDQRAWVGPKIMRLSVLEVGKHITAEVELTNTGRTAAIGTEVDAMIYPSFQLLDIDAFAISAERIHTLMPFQTAIFPSVEVTVPATTNGGVVTDNDMRLIRDGQLNIYYFGEVAYKDVFGKRHLTEFCGLYEPTSFRFSACEQHSRAD